MAEPLRNDTMQLALAALCGLLLPFYLFDESVALKAALAPAIPASVLAWLVASHYDGHAGSGTWRLAIITFAVTFFGSVTASAMGAGVTINAFYPFFFLALCMRTPNGVATFTRILFISLLCVTLLGWYRFVTVTGGSPAEHAFGYWGIKYTAATRNSDALAPMLVAGLAMASLQHTGRAGSALQRILLWMALIIALPALALTFSRGAWIAVLLMVLLGSRANWRVLLRTTLLIAVSGTALLLLAALLMPEAFADAVNLVALLNRLESIYDPDIQSSNDERAQLLTYAVALGFEHPVFGAGAAQFNCCTADLGFPELAENLHPENIFLHLYSEYGLLPAVTAFLILGLAALHGLSQQEHHQRMAGAALISLIVWLQLNSELPSLFIWTVLGVLCSVAIHVPDSAETESK